MSENVSENVVDESVRLLREDFVEYRLKAAKLQEDIAKLRKQLATTESHADDLLTQIRQYEDESAEAGESASESQSDPPPDASGGSVVAGVSVYAVNSNIAIVPPSKAVESVGDDAWKSTPITVLRLAEIAGLGPAKRARLIESVPTIGALESIRAEASLKCVPFASLLPKGIGQATSDEIEERTLNWLRDNQGRFGVTAATGSYEPQPPPELDTIPDIRLKHSTARQTREMGRDYIDPPPTPEEIVRDVINPWMAGTQLMPDGMVILPEPSGGEAETAESKPTEEPDMEPEDTEEYLRHRYRKMLKRFEKVGPILGATANTTYDDGREAARRGFSLVDCNWSPGERQDQWLLGFIAEGGREEPQSTEAGSPA